MLSVAQDLVNELTPYQSALSAALNAAASLPLVGKQFKDLQDLQSIFQNSLSSIDVQTQNLTSGHFTLSVPLTTISHTFTFDLGLDAFLQVSTSGGVAASITPTLNVAFDYQNGNVSLDTADTNLDIGFELTLPNFQATMSLNGLLYTHAVDAGTDFKGDIKFSLDSDNSVDFSGTAHIALGLTVSFVDPALNASFNPTFFTTLKIDWGFDTQSGQLMTPQIQLQDFSLDADSFLHNFLGDIVTTVQKYTQPLEPFLKTFDTPVPIASAFGSNETIGDLILQGANISQDQQARFNLMVKVINAVNSIDLSGSTGGAKIDFGTINLTGNAEQAGQFSFDTNQLGGAIGQIFNSPLLQEVKGDLQDLASYTGLTSTAGFQFPLLENPSDVILGILTGQTKDMFTFSTGREHFELSVGVGFGIPDVLGIFLNAGMVFDADFTMGYDTSGLTKFIQDHQAVDLLHGFYFDNSVDTTDQPVPNVPNPRKTALYLSGSLDVKASAGVTITGGLFANIAMELADTDNSPHVHLDDMINNIHSKSKVFNFTGKLYAAATLSLTLDDPIGPDITLFSYTLAEYDILNYDPPPPPASKGLPIVVIDNPGSHSLLLDTGKMAADADITVQPFEDVSVVDGGQTVDADGIRVDYPNEIDLYVERKSGATTNYYNFIGLDGAVPDGVQVNVTDPFRVFADEGVPDPTPAQTTDGILLAGGKNVLYNYSEDPDGSHPTVVLIGGYGSNTLTGGTAEFGNFVPGNFSDRAKAQFGNTSGFDGQALGFIGSAVDGMAMPATPGGIIGATLTASRGALMVGGPGDNNFIAAGGGAYEMDGNSWLDTFTISPSFNGQPATYLIDGGPGGDINSVYNSLYVRVPAGDDADFENGTAPDKYNPAFQSLDIFSNAGLFATAHGIQSVVAIGAPGSSVTLGDTSELNINFQVTGSAHLTFGGSNKPDLFNVSTASPFYETKDYFIVPNYEYLDNVFFASSNQGASVPPPVYTITRTFGTNGRTQTIPFAIENPDSSSLTLDGRGASDTYNLAIGLGAFIDVTVDDSDPTTQNKLTVNVGDSALYNNQVVLTDDAVHLDYYTKVVLWSVVPEVGSNPPGYDDYYFSSVHYTPSVFFGANEDITLSGVAFSQTIVDRPMATQQATILFNQGQFTTSPTLGFGPQNRIYDLLTENPQFIDTTTVARAIDIQANAGSLTLDRSISPTSVSIEIDGNSGTLTLDTFNSAVSVLGNSGTLNFLDGTQTQILEFVIDSQIDIGGNYATSSGNLANVHGTINIAGDLSFGGIVDVIADDRGGTETPADWTLDSTSVQIGDLTINVSDGAPYLNGDFDMYWRTGTHVTRVGGPPLIATFNGSTAFPIAWSQNFSTYNTDGDNVSVSLANSFMTSLSGSVTYSAQNLPPGLSLNPSTGLITGTIPIRANAGSPFNSVVTATDGDYTLKVTLMWTIASTISFYVPFVFDPFTFGETVPVSLDPIYVFDPSNQPVTVTVTGLPPGITFDPNTDVISGTVPAGGSAHGPFDVNIHADDGIETADYPFTIDVSGIQIPSSTPFRLNHKGDTVDFFIHASSIAGGTIAYSADQLPGGITLNPTTGEISGTLTDNVTSLSQYFINFTYDDGFSTKTTFLNWQILPVGTVDTITYPSPGTQTSVEGDSIDLFARATSSLDLPMTFTAEGLPPGLSINYDRGYTVLAEIIGSPAPGAAENSPYHVTLTATDGIYSGQTTFTWNVTAPVLLTGDLNHDGQVGAADVGRLTTALSDPSKYEATAQLSPAEFNTLADVNGDGVVNNVDIQALICLIANNSAGSGGGATTDSSNTTSSVSIVPNLTVAPISGAPVEVGLANALSPTLPLQEPLAKSTVDEPTQAAVSNIVSDKPASSLLSIMTPHQAIAHDLTIAELQSDLDVSLIAQPVSAANARNYASRDVSIAKPLSMASFNRIDKLFATIDADSLTTPLGLHDAPQTVEIDAHFFELGWIAKP